MGLYILFESLLISLGVLAWASSISNSIDSFISRSATDLKEKQDESYLDKEKENLSAPSKTATLTMYL